MIQTLQSIINVLENPAYLRNKKEILLVNDLFTSCGFSQENFEKQIKTKNYKINKKQINKTLTLCEIIPDDVYTLRECTKKLTEAVSIL